MAAKSRSSLLASDGVSVLEDLDAFLEEVEEEGEQPEPSQPFLAAGASCASCRVSDNPALASLASGHWACLKEILHSSQAVGGNLQGIRDESGGTMVHIAARNGDLESLKVIMAADRSLCEVGDHKGAAPLHVCAYHGHVDCLRCLLGLEHLEEEAVEPKVWRNGLTRDQDGATALHFAAASGHTACLRVLVEEVGGDPDEQTNSGETPGNYHSRVDPRLSECLWSQSQFKPFG